jgi:hypothetical protein
MVPEVFSEKYRMSRLSPTLLELLGDVNFFRVLKFDLGVEAKFQAFDKRLVKGRSHNLP